MGRIVNCDFPRFKSVQACVSNTKMRLLLRQSRFDGLRNVSSAANMPSTTPTSPSRAARQGPVLPAELKGKSEALGSPTGSVSRRVLGGLTLSSVQTVVTVHSSQSPRVVPSRLGILRRICHQRPGLSPQTGCPSAVSLPQVRIRTPTSGRHHDRRLPLRRRWCLDATGRRTAQASRICLAGNAGHFVVADDNGRLSRSG